LFSSTRTRLILSLLGVSLLVGIVSLFIGVRLLYNTVLNEAYTRIRLDLNAAREIYDSRIKNIYTALDIASLDKSINTYDSQEKLHLVSKLENIARKANLDFLGITDAEGETYCRIGPIPASEKPQEIKNPIVKYLIENYGKTAMGTVVLDRSFLMDENPSLAEQARIELIPTPRAAPIEEKIETSTMALCAAVPIYKNDKLLGVIYGGIVLSRNNEIVDTVRETVFRDEVYKGRSIGTATIFYNDIRISTNVLTPEGKRAIGTRVSEEVRNRVLVKGERWTDRAFVVSDWYITAYEPIEDIFGRKVGILYTGVLEEKYVDVRKNVVSVFILITLAGMVVSIGLGYLVANNIMRPVGRLISASQEVSRGNLNPDIGPLSASEIGVLQNTFSRMLSSLRERDKLQRAELLQSEKQASIGRLAAGVAHEINNPLTGVLTFTHLLLRRADLNEEVLSDLKVIANETERVRQIVKGLLDFSRQTELESEPTDINQLVNATVTLVDNEALVKGLKLEFLPGKSLPRITVDRSQLQSVLMNIIINAFDATEPGGSVIIKTGMGYSPGKINRKGIEISVTDTGHGIPQENLDRLFDPFFTTKDVGQGTGLGLAVSYGIVERHGGTIRVWSEVGKGSTFTIWLPLEEKGES